MAAVVVVSEVFIWVGWITGLIWIRSGGLSSSFCVKVNYYFLKARAWVMRVADLRILVPAAVSIFINLGFIFG